LVDEFPSSADRMNLELAAALAIPIEPFMQIWRQTSDMRTSGVFQTVEESLKYACGTIGAPVTKEQIDEAVAIRLRHTRRALEPRPGAVSTLAQLKNQGHKLALLSNCSIEIPILWPETAFADLIDQPVFSSRECLKKPDPRIYRLVCERLGVMPQDCLYVADGENYELKAAAAVGIHPLLIRTPSREILGEVLREAREWKGDIIAALSEVLDITDKRPS
jgi:putative hydrolase of the HAD superfamily